MKKLKSLRIQYKDFVYYFEEGIAFKLLHIWSDYQHSSTINREECKKQIEVYLPKASKKIKIDFSLF